MTREIAESLLATGDLLALKNNRHVGVLLSEIYRQVIDVAYGETLDAIGEKLFTLDRFLYLPQDEMCGARWETDVEFRQRLQGYGSILDLWVHEEFSMVRHAYVPRHWPTLAMKPSDISLPTVSPVNSPSETFPLPTGVLFDDKLLKTLPYPWFRPQIKDFVLMPSLDSVLGCSHEWKTYHGLNHIDEYCVKCNQKKG